MSHLNEKIQALINKKNQWLYSQVDVKYPTEESLKGRDLYKLFQDSPKEYISNWTSRPLVKGVVDDLYIVDFHRLTIVFACLFSKQWKEKESQAYIVEFLTQIILEPDFPIFIGFKNGEPIGCALGTMADGEMLISDIYLSDEGKHSHEEFIQQIINVFGDSFDIGNFAVELNNE